MTAQTQEPDRAQDFEFTVLQAANHYRAALLTEFRPHLRGQVLEVGAGIGQITELLLQEPGIERLAAVEPDARFAAMLRRQFPGLDIIQGTIDDVPAAPTFDAILSVNVLEHIALDERELSVYHDRLAERRGTLCLFVPARPEIFGSIDRDFGHCRRYRRGELKRKLESVGFRVQHLSYFNLAGYFAWWWNYCLRQQHGFNAASVRLFDRFIFPLQHKIESRLLRPPIGQSLLALATAD
jgi:SAM-dependent methyltransferase